MKRKILFMVSILLIVVALFVACDRTPESCKDIYAGKQLVDAYGVVKKPIANPEPDNEWDQKVDSSHFTVDGDFEDNQVIVGLTNSESLNNLYYTYSEQDFPGYGVIEVEPLQPEEYIERFRNEYKNGIASTDKGLIHPSKFHRSFGLTLNVHSKENVLLVMSELIKRKDVVVAEPNGIMHPFSVQIDLTNSDNQWGNAKIDLAGAWQYNMGSADVKVGVMDSGVAKHPSLVDNLSDTRKVYGYQGYDMGLSDNYGISESLYIKENSLYYQGHGTSVAGVVGAKLQGTNGAQGVCKALQ